MALIATASPSGAESAAEPMRLYARLCSACHGLAGDGHGPAAPWLWPAPRNFTRGVYQWRSTSLDAPPVDGDLRAAIAWGAPGTSMPGFEGIVSPQQLDELVLVVKQFAPSRFQQIPKMIIAEPKPHRGDLARGQQVWLAMGCNTCHGDGGRGDGPAAASLRDDNGNSVASYDLTTQPLRRPRAPASDLTQALHDSIATGLAGTPMPGFSTRISDDDVWNVADFIDSIGFHGARNVRDATLTSSQAIAADEENTFDPGIAIAPQGTPPATLTPAQASLSERQCARCHAKQAREWQGSIHAQASSPGLLAQIMRSPARGDAKTAWLSQPDVASCQRCHAPLAEQLASNPALYDDALQAEGITCAGCHVRGFVRHGPPRIAPTLLTLPSYPLVEDESYQRSDFCMPCHQLPARQAIAGRPLLNTYREWLEGPYMKRGVQCQHCHMPNREHTWKGVHDADTFRQGIDVHAQAYRGATGIVTVRATLTNIGAGHYLPTTTTPAVWLRVQLIDKDGLDILGANREQRIGRKLVFDSGAWKQLEDTRVPPGESIALDVAWRDGRVASAASAIVTVEVHPDDYYEGFYRSALASSLTAPQRARFEQALKRAQASYYVALRQTIAIASP